MIDRQFIKEIWDTETRVSDLSGQYLGDVFSMYFYHHILTKKAFPKLRKDRRNILKVTPEEHNIIHSSQYNEKWQYFWHIEKRKEELRILANHRTNRIIRV